MSVRQVVNVCPRCQAPAVLAHEAEAICFAECTAPSCRYFFALVDGRPGVPALMDLVDTLAAWQRRYEVVGRCGSCGPTAAPGEDCAVCGAITWPAAKERHDL